MNVWSIIGVQGYLEQIPLLQGNLELLNARLGVQGYLATFLDFSTYIGVQGYLEQISLLQGNLELLNAPLGVQGYLANFLHF